MQTHPLTIDAHQAVVDFSAADRRFALAVVMRTSGSTPRKAGTKALLGEDGSIWGTIGGGLLEFEARRRAVEAIRTGRAVLYDFPFSGTDAAEGEPVCGGTMRLLIDPTAGRHRQVYAAAAEARRRRRRGTLVTAVRETPETVTDVRWFPAEQTPRVDDEPDALVEPIVPDPLLVIVGGGHVAQALAWQADLVGFDLLVVEDRPEYARPDLFPPRAEVRCGDAAGILAGMSLDDETYVALVSRGHLTDAKALAACIDKPCRYIGMMGSRRKAALLRRDFLRRGLATAEQFDRVHAPIGLDLGGRTVPEIAAGIVAELIAARHQRRTPAIHDEPEAARP